MSAANEAAAGLVGSLAAELVEKIPAHGDDILGQEVAELRQSVEAVEEPSSEEATVAQEVEQETAAENELDIPNYTPEIPDDLQAELDEPDFEEDARIEAEFEGNDEVYDEIDSEERRRRIAAEKKAAWLEGRLQEQNRSKWEAEALKYFPLAEHSIKTVQADSRRAFLRQAKTAHEAILPYVKPLVEKLAEATEQARAQAKAEGREEAKTAWGAPTTGPGVVPVTASAAAAELEEARKSRNLSKIIGVLMKQGG